MNNNLNCLNKGKYGIKIIWREVIDNVKIFLICLKIILY